MEDEEQIENRIGDEMSYIIAEKEEYFKCPGCRKILRVSWQRSEGYGDNLFVEDPLNTGKFLDKMKYEDALKEINIFLRGKGKRGIDQELGR